MNKEELYKDIETQLMNNRTWIHSRSLTTGFNSEYFKDYLRINNDLLGNVKSYLNTHDETKEYERGVRECCAAIIKIVNDVSDGGISIAELKCIFDTSYDEDEEVVEWSEWSNPEAGIINGLKVVVG